MVRKRGVARRSFSHRRIRRVQKYDHNVIPRRFKIQLPDFADRLKPLLDVHVECEEPTMELLESLGVPSDEQQYYLGFMKRMIELYRKFTSETLQLEKDSLIAEYVLRGKDKDVLEQVQVVAEGCAFKPPTISIVFTEYWNFGPPSIFPLLHSEGWNYPDPPTLTLLHSEGWSS